MVKRLFIVLAALLAVPVSLLDVGTEPGQRVASAWLVREAVVDVSYTHSVECTRVQETYRADRSGISLKEMVWQSSGAGLPDSYDSWENGYYTSETRVPVGKLLSCWFLPLNDPEVRLNNRLVLRGWERPAFLRLRVRTLPLGIQVLLLIVDRCG